MKLVARDARGIAGAADAGGKTDMQDIQALPEKAFEIIFIFLYIDLGGSCLCTCSHTGIEFRKGDGLPQIIWIFLSVQLIVKTNIVDSDCFEVFF